MAIVRPPSGNFILKQCNGDISEFEYSKCYEAGPCQNVLMMRPGEMVSAQREETRFLFALRTKGWEAEATFDTVLQCLERLADLCRMLKVRQLAMTRIAPTVLWSSVAHILCYVFYDWDMELTVYSTEL